MWINVDLFQQTKQMIKSSLEIILIQKVQVHYVGCMEIYYQKLNTVFISTFSLI